MGIEIKKFLYDIKVSIDSINDYLKCKDFDHYCQNKLIRRAVERELEIIGEAVNNILKSNSQIILSDARKFVDLRNIVIHGYDKVDDVIIWGVLCNQLPKLKHEVEELLEEK